MKNEEELSSLTIEELLIYRDRLRHDNNSLKNQISKLETEIESTSRDNERQEEQLMISYRTKIDELRNANLQSVQQIQKEEDTITKDLNSKVTQVLMEKDQFEQRLKYDQDQLIHKLQAEIEQEKGTEILLESQNLDDFESIDFNNVSPELHNQYDQYIQEKNEKVVELMLLSQQIEKLITRYTFLSHKIMSTQMNTAEPKPLKPIPSLSKPKVIINTESETNPAQSHETMHHIRRYSYVSGVTHKRKRRISHK